LPGIFPLCNLPHCRKTVIPANAVNKSVISKLCLGEEPQFLHP
jgi:hypothetical protein